MFDTMLNVMSVTTQAPTEKELEAGASPELVLSLVPALILPVADPENPNQPIIVPAGHLRFRIDGEAAVSVGRKMIEEGERLPRRPRVEVATSLSGAEDAARRLEGLRG